MKTYYRGLYKSVSRLGASKSQCHGISPVTCRNKWTLFQHVLADTNLQLSCEIFASHICLSPVTRKPVKCAAPTPLLFPWRFSVPESQMQPGKVHIIYPMLFSTPEISRKQCYKQHSCDRGTWSMQIRWTQARKHLPPLSTDAISWHPAPLKSCRWQVP